jgi:hypothetical protein
VRVTIGLCAALTRAREAVIVVGPEAAIRTALHDTQGDVRLTSLHHRLATAADNLGLDRSCTTHRLAPHMSCAREYLLSLLGI